jgi:predicted enzyme related to lactoylglutathione lyase
VVWFEIGCRDLTRTAEFYSALLGWQIAPEGHAGMANTNSTQGIGGHISRLGHEPHHYITIYAQVDDLAAYVQRAIDLGGKQVVPPTEVPGMGHFAWIADPDGTVFGLWKPLAG